MMVFGTRFLYDEEMRKHWEGDRKHDERNDSRDRNFGHFMFNEYFVVMGTGLSTDYN